MFLKTAVYLFAIFLRKCIENRIPLDQSNLDLHSVQALSEVENCVGPEPNYILQTRFYGIVSIVVLFSDSVLQKSPSVFFFVITFCIILLAYTSFLFLKHLVLFSVQVLKSQNCLYLMCPVKTETDSISHENPFLLYNSKVLL